MIRKLTCEICKKEIITSKYSNKRQKYCSTYCQRQGRRRGECIDCEKIIYYTSIRCASCATIFNFKKYGVSDETRKKISLARKGKKMPEHLKKKLSEERDSAGNPNWKGDKVGFKALHTWIKGHKLKPKFCEICKVKPPFELANLSGEYKRDINDFIWVCRKCHMENDGRMDMIKNLRQVVLGKKKNEYKKKKEMIIKK